MYTSASSSSSRSRSIVHLIHNGSGAFQSQHLHPSSDQSSSLLALKSSSLSSSFLSSSYIDLNIIKGCIVYIIFVLIDGITLYRHLCHVHLQRCFNSNILSNCFGFCGSDQLPDIVKDLFSSVFCLSFDIRRCIASSFLF